MRNLLMGIDIGTSSCKAAVFDKNGTVIISCTREYPVYYPDAGWAEQDPEDWWKAVCSAVKNCLECGGIDSAEIVSVGIDGQSWSAIPIDKDGKVLCRTPIWMDTRSESICRETEARIGSDAIFNVSGNALSAQYTTGKVLWYRKERPEVYEKTESILQCNSFLVYRLTGKVSQDLSQGYGWHCFDMRSGTWDDAMRRELDIPEKFLPEIFHCHDIVGTVTKEAAVLCGLKEGTPVVAGGLDAACGTLGVGVLEAGETQEQGGQAGGMSICLDTYKADPRLILGYHVVPDRWLLQGGTTGGGGVMRWLEQEFADYERSVAETLGKSSLDQFNEIAAKVPAGSDGMVFLPYMSGERSPIWDTKAKGVWYGLDFRKTKGHFVRSAMEGVAFSLRHNLETAVQAGAEAKVLRSMGGSANSLLWTQIKADITGKRIVVPNSDTATTLGAAILAGVGAGMYKDFAEAVSLTVKNRREHLPNAEYKEIYDKNYEIYLELYEQLKGTMHKGGN